MVRSRVNPVHTTDSTITPEPIALGDSVLNPVPSVEVDTLAEALHNAQVAELRKQTESSGIDPFTYSTWDELTEASKQSRRSTARYLLTKFDILTK